MANKKDLAVGLLNASINTSVTTIVLQSGQGALMPAVPFFATITPAGQLSTAANSEIVSVTAVATDTLTVVRAQKGTTAKSFSASDVLGNGVYVDDIVTTDPWANWTPTLTNSGGSISATATVAKWTQIGKTVLWQAVISISSVSGGGALGISAPVASATAGVMTGSGREDASTGKHIEVMFKSSSTVMTCFFYDNLGSTASGGYLAVVNGSYQAA